MVIIKRNLTLHAGRCYFLKKRFSKFIIFIFKIAGVAELADAHG